ncbi:MAG: glycosyltransferase family 4 protein [Firmicutes bacterium]|nr:glycosyltransferase family 4 protein [Bacillota bacterium]
MDKSSKRKFNILVLANGSFPIGAASTNRLVSYCRGIVELGHLVKVVVLCPHEKENGPIDNFEISGIYKGINYQHAAKTTIWPNSKLRKSLLLFKGLFNSIAIVRHEIYSKKIDLLFFGSGSSKFRYLIPFYIISRIYNIKLIREKNEYPAFELRKENYSVVYRYFARRYLFRFYDGMLIMTYPLIDYFRTITRKSAKLELLPMTVEPDRFNCSINNTLNQRRQIVYTGSMWGNKDGVDILIESFGLIANHIKDVDLLLIGDISNKTEYDKLRKKLDDIGLVDRVMFTGRIHRDDIPQYLCKASVLVLSRPTSFQATGGFPTKLGEYLATGIPVVITKVGDIPRYLEDRKNAFLAEPDSAEAFAQKLTEVLSQPELARKIGLEGKRLTEDVFNYKKQAERIIEFINSL